MAELAIALDMPDRQSAVSLAEKLSAGLDGVAGKVWFKVGMELYTAAGPAVVEAIKTLGFAVFLDLKYHDIPNTVAGAMRAAARLKVDMANVHICGGEAMVRAAVAGAREGAESAGGRPPILLGVTVLTSLGPQDLAAIGLPAELYRADMDDAARLKALALLRAGQAKAWGLDGVVCSGHEAAGIKEACGRDFVCLTPGMRPRAGEVNDQSRVMTPAQAVAAGADFLVVGRPITGAADPLAAMRAILREMEEAGKR